MASLVAHLTIRYRCAMKNSKLRTFARYVPLTALLLLPAASPRADPMPLADSSDGMTCYYYAAAGRLPWRRNGGDWVDRTGKSQGDVAYATVTISQRSAAQQVRLDVSDLARAWQPGSNGHGAILLRRLGTKGVVVFSSRESDDVEARPRLELEWDDGSRASIDASADASLPCPTHRGVGTRKTIKVETPAVLVFPIELKKGRRIARATLLLHSPRQFQGGATIGAFRADPPANHASERKTGIAEKYPGDARLESDPDVIFVERFEAPDWGKAWSNPPKLASPVSTDAANRFEPVDRKALKVTIAEGKQTGLNMHFRFASTEAGEPDEAFFRYYLRLSENWNPTNTGGKLPGLSGTYDRAGWGGRKWDGERGWSARGAYFATPKGQQLADYRPIGSYVYHSASETYGSSLGWGLGATGMLKKNRWYSVEQQVRLNRPGHEDGILRAWIDGHLVYERTDLVFRTVPELKIESVWMNVFHGGTEAAPADLTLYLDNVVIARRYIGPMATDR